MAALPENVPTIVVAESFSGLVLAKVLGKQIESVIGGVFCATFASPPKPVALRLISLLPLETILRIPAPEFVLRRLCLGEDATNQLVSSLKHVLSRLPSSVIARRLRLISKANVLPELSRIAVPCCYIRGIDDRLVPPTCVKQFQASIPSLTEQAIPGPHFLLQAKPKECWSIVQGFTRPLTRRCS